MEYILNIDIFDEEIGSKFDEFIRADKENYDKEKIYKLTVSFHVNLLKDKRFEDFNAPEPPYKRKKVSREEKIGDVLSFQLDRLEEVLKKHEIESDSLTIQGDNLEAEDIIKIDISVDTSEPRYIGKGKNRRRDRSKGHLIDPNKPATLERMSKLMHERLIELYRKYLKNPIGDKKLISEILGINETEDEGELCWAFAQQYQELWLTTTDNEKVLLDRLKAKTLSVLYKNFDGEAKAILKDILIKENIQIND